MHFNNNTLVEVYSIDVVGGVVTIPKRNDAYMITRIGHNAFHQLDIDTVIIPHTVTTIDNFAFSRSSIKEITIPNSVMNIGPAAFFNCQSLEKVVFEEDSPITEIKTDMFCGCTNLKEIVNVPQRITEIGERAFSDTKSLRSFDFSRTNLVSIETASFSGSAIEEASFPSTLEDIFPNAFWGCKELKKIEFSCTRKGKCVRLKRGAFSKCSALKEIVIPYSYDTYSFGKEAFKETGLEELDLSHLNGLVFEEAVFKHSKLKKIKLPNTNCTKLSKECFAYTPLKEITIPQSVEAIGAGCFVNSALEKINWPETLTLEETILEVQYKAFACTCLKEVSLPKYVKLADGEIFSSCFKLEKVDMQNVGTFDMPFCLFHTCANLKEVILPKTLKGIGESVFAGTAIKSLALPNSLLWLDSFAFEKMQKLEALDLSKTQIDVIPRNLATGSPNITSVKLPPYLTILSKDAFDSQVLPYVSKDNLFM